MLVIAMAGLFSFLLSRAGVPAQIGAWIIAHLDSAWAFLIAVNVFLLVIGMFVETRRRSSCSRPSSCRWQ